MKMSKKTVKKMGLSLLVTGMFLSLSSLAQEVGEIRDVGSTPAAAEPNLIGIGQISRGGTACWALADQDFPIVLTETKLRLPLGLMVKQVSGAMKRGSCSLTIPVTIPEGYRAIVANSGFEGFVNLGRQGHLRSQIELFKPGLQTQGFKAELTAGASRIKEILSEQRMGEVFSTDCGESFNLRVNSSAILEGEWRSTVRLDYLDFDLLLEKCQ